MKSYLIQIQELLNTIAKPLLPESSKLSAAVTLTANASFGDYTSNFALQCFKLCDKEVTKANSPIEMAKFIATQISSNLPKYLESVTVAGPGFINFKLNTSYLHENFKLPEFAKRHETAIVEYMQPNTNKPLHVGHLRNATLGKSLINLLTETGWDVVAATVNNDRGLHITKSMWAYLMKGEKTPTEQTWKVKLETWVTNPSAWVNPSEMPEAKLHKGDFFVGHWYVIADTFAEDTVVLKEWQDMLLAWENTDDAEHAQVRKLWKQMNDWFYEGMTESYKHLGVTFDPNHIAFESEIYAAGKEIILDGVKKGIFEKLEDGAVRANLETQFKLPNKILLRKDGTGIYMTFDIELTRERCQEKPNLIVWVVGKDQDLYFQQLFAVSELLGYGQKKNFFHFSYGMVRLPEGKMSSRKGSVVYADEVLADAITTAQNVMESAGVGKDLDEKVRAQVAAEVGIGAVKYTILAYDPQSEIAFDVQKSVTFEGDSGPYIQYAHARCASILSKIGSKATQEVGEWQEAESVLVHKLEKLQNTIARAANEYAPHLLCTYLLELTQEFGRFYSQCPVLGNSRREQLTENTAKTLELGLKLLGITAPQKM